MLLKAGPYSRQEVECLIKSCVKFPKAQETSKALYIIWSVGPKTSQGVPKIRKMYQGIRIVIRTRIQGPML